MSVVCSSIFYTKLHSLEEAARSLVSMLRASLMQYQSSLLLPKNNIVFKYWHSNGSCHYLAFLLALPNAMRSLAFGWRMVVDCIVVQR